MKPNDIELYNRLAENDREALRELYERYERLLFSFTYKMTGQADLAEEVVQEVFIKLWTKKGMYDSSKGKFTSWLLTITRNVCIDQIRKKKEDGFKEGEMETLKSSEPAIEEQAEWKEKTAVLKSAIKDLGKEQQDIIQLFYFQALSQKEIADTCQIPLGTVKGRIRLALKHLRKKIEARGEGGADE